MSNRFKYNKYSTNNKKKEYSLNMNEYPDLNTSVNASESYLNKNDNDTINFAGAILKEIPVVDNIETLKPGWISIQFKNNNFIYKYGPSLKKEPTTDLDNPNIIMNNIINKINDNRERYKNEYNAINGDHAYEELYEKYNIYEDYSDIEDNEQELDQGIQYDEDNL